MKAFVGRDRRRAPSDAGLRWVFTVGATAVLAVTVVFATIAGKGRPASAVTVRDLGLVLDTVASIAAAAAFAVCISRSRLVGESAPLWAGTAAVTLGAAGTAVPGVAGRIAPSAVPGGAAAWAAAGVVVGLLLLAAVLVAADVDTRVSAGRLVGVAAAGIAVLVTAFHRWPAVGRALSIRGLGDGGAPTVTAAAAAGALASVATVLVLRSVRRQWLYGWSAVLAFGVLLAQVAEATALHRGGGWTVTAAAVRAVALLAAATGGAVELGRAYVAQRARLFETELTMEAAAVQERLDAAIRRTQRHDVRNAVFAVEGAAVTLERHFERLTGEDRTMLKEMLSSGVERIQRLMDDGRGSPSANDEAGADLGTIARAVVAELRWDGRVTFALDGDLAGRGSTARTSEVVRLLLANAEDRAPGGPVMVTGARDGEWVVLRIHDGGPAISRHRRRLFHAGATASGSAPVPGDVGVGLQVAARLMRDQGGDLWVESDTDDAGSTAFALCLRALEDGSGEPEDRLGS